MIFFVFIVNFFILMNKVDPFLTSSTSVFNFVESEQRQIEDYIGKAATGSKLECKECKKSFSAKSKASLIAHIESSHLRSSITCEVCTKQFKATSYLKQHQKRGACATPQ